MPTVLRIRSYGFSFFNNEGQEPTHVHVKSGGGQAKLWLNPVGFASNYKFNAHELSKIKRIIAQHQEELMEAWNEYFS